MPRIQHPHQAHAKEQQSDCQPKTDPEIRLDIEHRQNYLYREQDERKINGDPTSLRLLVSPMPCLLGVVRALLHVPIDEPLKKKCLRGDDDAAAAYPVGWGHTPFLYKTVRISRVISLACIFNPQTERRNPPPELVLYLFIARNIQSIGTAGRHRRTSRV